jgi:hypothetical protein
VRPLVTGVTAAVNARADTVSRWSPRQVAVVVRFLVLALVLVISLLSDHARVAIEWFPLLLAGAVVASARDWGRSGTWAFAILGSLACVVGVLESGGANSPLYPFLIAPAFAAGLLTGIGGAVVGPGVAGLAFVFAGQIRGEG